MNELPFIETANIFQEELERLHFLRKEGKTKSKRNYRLTKKEREIIFLKTDGRCHVCGEEILINNFEADHVKSHSSGGTSVTDNFLPACKTCNNYRWHYLPQEFQWILKLGIWTRTAIENKTTLGNKIAIEFISHETQRENRRKEARTKS